MLTGIQTLTLSLVLFIAFSDNSAANSHPGIFFGVLDTGSIGHNITAPNQGTPHPADMNPSFPQQYSTEDRSCQTIKVSCVGGGLPGGGVTYPTVCSDECILFLTSGVCLDVGLKSGDTLRDSEIDPIRDSIRTYQPSSVNDAISHCIYDHELKHIQDFNDHSSRRPCKMEQSAYNETKDCLDNYKQNGFWTAEEKRGLEHAKAVAEIGRLYNALLCNLNVTSQAECEHATAICVGRTNVPWFILDPDWDLKMCEKFEKLYCDINIDWNIN